MLNKQNPFEVTFGKEPFSLISREEDIRPIKESFDSDRPNSQVYIITGPRGSGKTVSMTSIVSYYKNKDSWLTIELNPELDMLEQLASKLYDEGKLKKLFLKADFNFSFHGIGFTIKGDNPLLNISSLINKELEYLKKKSIKVLISIDEISSNKNVKAFVSEYQLWLRNNKPVYLLMTGLYQNVSALQKEKTLTFLYRAPKVDLRDLNPRAIANSYKKIFEIDEAEAIKLAKVVSGYAFAYQLLGDILFRNNKKILDDDVIKEFDELIYERAYLMIFNELSAKEKQILLCACNNSNNQYILNQLGLKPNGLSNYKAGLAKKGLIVDNERSDIIFKLPRFKEFIEFIQNYE